MGVWSEKNFGVASGDDDLESFFTILGEHMNNSTEAYLVEDQPDEGTNRLGNSNGDTSTHSTGKAREQELIREDDSSATLAIRTDAPVCVGVISSFTRTHFAERVGLNLPSIYTDGSESEWVGPVPDSSPTSQTHSGERSARSPESDTGPEARVKTGSPDKEGSMERLQEELRRTQEKMAKQEKDLEEMRSLLNTQRPVGRGTQAVCRYRNTFVT